MNLQTYVKRKFQNRVKCLKFHMNNLSCGQILAPTFTLQLWKTLGINMLAKEQKSSRYQILSSWHEWSTQLLLSSTYQWPLASQEKETSTTISLLMIRCEAYLMNKIICWQLWFLKDVLTSLGSTSFRSWVQEDKSIYIRIEVCNTTSDVLEEVTIGFTRTLFFCTWRPASEHLMYLPRARACNLTIPTIQWRVETACLLTKCPRTSACNLIIPLRARNALRTFKNNAQISRQQWYFSNV